MPLYLLASAFTIWMAVEAVRRGDARSWLWIILVFGPMGAAVYFVTEYLGAGGLTRISFRPRKVTADDLRRAEADVRRLDNAPSWTEYASLLRARKDYSRAAEAAARAVERAPQSQDARYELGLAELGRKRFREAAAELQQVVSKDRCYDTDNALFALSQAQKEAGEIEAARQSLLELSERRARPEILYDLATVQGLLGDREGAARSLQRIVDEAELVPGYLQRDIRPWVRKARQGLKRLT